MPRLETILELYDGVHYLAKLSEKSDVS